MYVLKQLRVNKSLQSKGVYIDNLTNEEEVISLAVLSSAVLGTPFLINLDGKLFTIDSRKILESNLVDYIDKYTEFKQMITNFKEEGITVKLGNSNLIGSLKLKIDELDLISTCLYFYNTYYRPFYKNKVYI